MSYMIKSPDAKNVKFAHVYLSSNMTDITIPGTGVAVATNQKCLFNSINASAGIGVTVSNGDITLSEKDYIVYVVPTINIVTGTSISNVPGTFNILLTLYLNGVEIVSQSKAEQNCTASSSNATFTFAGNMGVAAFSAQGGDVLSLLLDADNLSASQSLGLRVIGNTDGDPHSLFIWEIDR
jgi:hypothetical protein